MKNTYISNPEHYEPSAKAYDSYAEVNENAYKAKYFRFLNDRCDESELEAKNFIETQLDKVIADEQTLPTNYADLKVWISSNAEEVGRQYQQYLLGRANGKPRRLFKNKSHALNFIKLVAPTKMVDGAWLYGFIKHPHDERVSKLINIYLDELGHGHARMNHVVLFRQLLTKYGCEELDQLSDKYFQQGAIQLALGCNAESFAPEIIGFNLAYEQLPLHLMITAYELKELNIDPYYFTLHVTVDNALTGHSKLAIDAFRDYLPQVGSQADYFKRVAAGMALNQDGLSTMSIINSYDIDSEIVEIFKRKSTLGKYMHGDHCSIGGKTINQWLENPQFIPEFLQTLVKNHWINRNEDPKNSKFWRLIEGKKAVMYGVFNLYEKQVIYDLIAGTALETLPRSERLGLNLTASAKNIVAKNLEAKHSVTSELKNDAPKNDNIQSSNIIEMKLNKKAEIGEATTFKFSNLPTSNSEDMYKDEVLFKQKIANMQDKMELMQLLTYWMSPTKHHSAIGLVATQFYQENFDYLK